MRAAGAARRARVLALATCAAMGSAVTRAQVPPTALPPLTVTEHQVRYRIDASQLQDLRQQVQAHLDIEGRRGHGRTHSRFEVSYTLLQEGVACRAEGLALAVEITTTLPEWRPLAEVPPETQSAWGLAMQALAEHEAVHRGHALAAASALQRGLANLPTARSCRELRTAIDRLTQRVVMKYRLKDDRFDARQRQALERGDSG